MRGAPPILWTATGFAAGAAAGAALGSGRTLVSLLILAVPILLWRGPHSRAVLLLVVFTGGLAWAAADRRVRDACTEAVRDGAGAVVTGYFTKASAEGASTLRPRPGTEGGCGDPIRVYARAGAPPEARPVTVEGRWVRSERPDGSVSIYLSASSVEETGGGEDRVPWPDRMRSAIRGRAADALERRLGAQAGVASALVLAERDGIPRELWDAFARSGSAHLLSISGFHVGVIAALLGGLIAATGRPPRTRAAGMAIGVWAYVLLIGAPTSATRAAWMTTAFVLGRLRQTPSRALGALGLSMLMIVLLRPSVVAGAGFQLTVAGTAGILVMTRWILRHWPAHRGRGWIASPVAAGLGASVFTAPVLAYHFGQVPLLSLPSSILLTPLVAAAVPGVIVTIAMDVLHLPGAALAGAGSEGLLHMVTATAAALGGLPGTVAPVTPREAALLTAGALLPLLLAGGARWRIRPAVRAAVSVLSALAVLWAGQTALALAGRGTLRIVAIDVGQGDAIALRTPGGRWFLVDAGPRGFGGSDAGLTRVVPYLHGQGARRLEAVVLTHPDEDHAGGLASVLRHVSAGAVVGPGYSGGQSGHMDGAAEARRAGIPWRRARAGDAWTVDGVDFEVLSPAPAGPHPTHPTHPATASPNDWSVVLRVDYGRFSALLMGDADAAIEARLLDQGPVTALKVGHHGSRTSTSEAFVRALSPGYALIPVGARNRYGHPDPAVLARLARAGARVYRTDRDGTITLTARGDGAVTVRGSRRRSRRGRRPNPAFGKPAGTGLFSSASSATPPAHHPSARTASRPENRHGSQTMSPTRLHGTTPAGHPSRRRSSVHRSLRRATSVSVLLLAAMWAAACGRDWVEPPANRPPSADVAFPEQTVHKHERTALNVAVHFSDPDGDELAFAAESSDDGVVEVFVSGSLLTLRGLTQGAARVSVTAADPDGLEAWMDMSVVVPNRPPRPVGRIPAVSVQHGLAFDVRVDRYIQDPDLDRLVFSVESSDPGVVSVSISGHAVRGVGMEAGTATVTVTGRDSGGLSAETDFIVTVVRSRDRDALVAIYEAAGGPGWRNNSGWLGPDPFRDWAGVVVSGERVRMLTLGDNGLSGTIPPEIGDLDSLNVLYLNDNELTGTIPPELGHLDGLLLVSVYGNELTGTIPPELGNLGNLWGLGLHGNGLTGTIPPELGNLANLGQLNLEGNFLTGPIPDSFLQLTRLTVFRFDDNDGLCVPDTDAFRAWLEDIGDYEGPICGD